MNRSGACAGYSDTYPRDCPTSKMQFSIHPPSTTEATFGGFPRCAPNWSFVYSHTRTRSVRVILNAPSSGLCANGNRAIFGVEALHLSRVANAQRARPIKDNAAARRFTQANGVEPYKEIQTKREE
ncbi:uncharacterized protein EI90DRAFT_3010655 [Cantharellus anzutake]|uniref:uncharacterized protein n=1 Tax=Cantharellus anzutake TaxID=1750568 RepID=UPI0019060FBB|nr:uncharacterized protein EI90DRAFT_3010655 [Cantharellus anzutake]KAF8343757.1 hypothetical protein EI90DRAFT_3010655 [Cantharellus anzutake]